MGNLQDPWPAEPLSLPPSDADLIAASRTGDAAAYDTLYRRHVAAAYSLARQLTGGQAEADDVVAETFAKLLDLLRRGGGPEDAFRPYLLTAIRRAAYDRHRAARRQVVTDEMEAFDPGVPFADPAVADLERTMIARAFASLPERWQAVLWHTEIEGARPAEVAPLLGLTANGVAALAYRAREGLRQAYLQMHLSGAAREECRPVAAKLGAYVRGGLAKRDAAAVAAHLDQCADCRGVFAELGDVNVALKGIVAPIVLGPAAAAYLLPAAAKGSAAGWIAGRLAWFRRAPKSQQAAAAGVAAAAAVGLAAAAMALAGHPGPAPGGARAHRAPPAAAAAPGPASAGTPGAPAPAARKSPTPRPGTSSQQARRQSSPPASSAPPPAPAAPATSAAAPGSPSGASQASRSAPAPAPPAPAARLTTRIDPVGTLPRGGTGIVAFTVTNTGPGPAAQVTARVTLPGGVTLLAAGTLGMASLDRASPGGWTCAPASGGASCTHGPLTAGASATSYLRVAVAGDAPAGTPPGISVDGGGRQVSARGTTGVSAGGFPARFAASGRYAVVTAGGTLSGASGAGDGNGCGASAWDWRTVPQGCQAGQASATLTLPGPRHGAGAWTAAAAVGWPGDDTGYLGWALVVVAADSAAPSGPVMVLDGTQPVDAADPGFSVPLAGLLTGPAARVHVVSWTEHGPHIAAFTLPLAARPAVSFAASAVPYLVGVIVATDSG